MDRRSGMFTHAFSESSTKPFGKNGLPRRDTVDSAFSPMAIRNSALCPFFGCANVLIWFSAVSLR